MRQHPIERHKIVACFLAPCADCGETQHMQITFNPKRPEEPHMVIQCLQCHATFVAWQHDPPPSGEQIEESMLKWQAYNPSKSPDVGGASIHRSGGGQ
ncbi:MAG: hypothetical protein GY851_21090 [bacterium]|nr:hypothetical protein [bacterium]